jgi:hypothetical protein
VACLWPDVRRAGKPALLLASAAMLLDVCALAPPAATRRYYYRVYDRVASRALMLLLLLLRSGWLALAAPLPTFSWSLFAVCLSSLSWSWSRFVAWGRTCGTLYRLQRKSCTPLAAIQATQTEATKAHTKHRGLPEAKARGAGDVGPFPGLSTEVCGCVRGPGWLVFCGRVCVLCVQAAPPPPWVWHPPLPLHLLQRRPEHLAPSL